MAVIFFLDEIFIRRMAPLLWRFRCGRWRRGRRRWHHDALAYGVGGSSRRGCVHRAAVVVAAVALPSVKKWQSQHARFQERGTWKEWWEELCAVIIGSNPTGGYFDWLLRKLKAWLLDLILPVAVLAGYMQKLKEGNHAWWKKIKKYTK
jgi:hypothetical protein